MAALLVAILACRRDLLDDVDDGPALRQAVSDFAAPGKSIDSARNRLVAEGFACVAEPNAGPRGIRCDQEGVRDDAVWSWSVTMHAQDDRITRIGTYVSRGTARRRLLPP